MTDIQPLSSDMIRHYLEQAGGDYSQDEDGDFYVEYEYEEDGACELQVWLSVEDLSTYQIHVADEKRPPFPRPQWDRITGICNTWNSTERYPVAYLMTQEEDPDAGDVRLDYHVYLPAGVTQQQLHDLTEEIIDTAFDFWDWAHREHGL